MSLASTTVSWLFLYCGVVLGALSLPMAKYSQGFTHIGYGVSAVFTYSMATICWVMAVRSLPLSTAYLVWMGLDVVAALILSIFLFHEVFTPMKLLFIVMIVIGCIGLNVMEVKAK